MEKEWWKEAVVYQIYPKSFLDTDGDGKGDLRGIIEKLDYIRELGANVLWICPVYQSPMDDNGYDISDYYHIDPSFGTDEDMEELLREADKRGMKILMDLVVNHTSDQHPWFQEALKNPESEYADYYIFREGEGDNPPNNWRSYFGGSAWERVEGTNRYYLHAFARQQPDLNWENGRLREKIYEMMNWWLDKGLGGFRVDAICNLKKNFSMEHYPSDGEDGLSNIGTWILNQPGIEVFLKEMSERTFRPHNSMTVAEANVPEKLLDRFIGKDGFFSMVFDFSYTDIDVPETGEWFLPTNWTIDEMREHIFKSQLDTQKRGWGAVYLENHDQMRSVNKYLKADEINDTSKKMLGTLFMMLRGTPFIYQGEEIGMTNIHMDSLEEYDDCATIGQYQRALEHGIPEEEAMRFVERRSRDNSRTPMQWSDEKNAGFSGAEQTWLKVNPNYPQINVKKAMAQEDSVWHHYRKLIDLRREGAYRDVAVYGKIRPIETQGSTICYERELDGKRILVLNNLGAEEAEVSMEQKEYTVLLSNYCDIREDEGKITLRAHESIVMGI